MYDSTMVELDNSCPRPRYRFKKTCRKVESSKVLTAILPPRPAFEVFAKVVLHKNEHVKQLKEQFQPYNRGFVVDPRKQDFTQKFASFVESKYSSFLASKKVDWEEAAPIFSFLPTNPENFCFTEKFTGIFSWNKLDQSYTA